MGKLHHVHNSSYGIRLVLAARNKNEGYAVEFLALPFAPRDRRHVFSLQMMEAGGDDRHLVSTPNELAGVTVMAGPACFGRWQSVVIDEPNLHSRLRTLGNLKE